MRIIIACCSLNGSNGNLCIINTGSEAPQIIYVDEEKIILFCLYAEKYCSSNKIK